MFTKEMCVRKIPRKLQLTYEIILFMLPTHPPLSQNSSNDFTAK